MTDLAIIIVSYNTRTDLERCLGSLVLNPPETRHEIIVVDNGSRDGSVEAVRSGWPEVRVMETGANLGFARANNLGIRASSAALILLLNSDTVVPAGAVDRLVEALRAHPESAVAGPRLVDGHGSTEISFGRMIGPFNELVQRLEGWAYRRGVPIVSRWVERRTRREHYPHWVSGACLLVWRHDAEAVGLLDERYFMYTEDVDFCAALRGRGRRVLFTPSAEVIHLRGRSTMANPVVTARGYRQSQLAFYAKHHPGWLSWLRLYLRLKGQWPGEQAGG